MKKPLFAIGFLLTLAAVNAQPASNGILLSGEVVYQEIVKMDIQLEGVEARLADQIPRERKTEKVLHFTEAAALLENLREEDPEEPLHAEGGGMMIKMYEPDNKTYIDLIDHKVTEQQEFMSRIFLIESDLEVQKWKMTGNQRTILDYACQEAITELDGKEVRAWFTPQIAVPAGPGRYRNLPGLVLAVEMNEGNRKLEAIRVELKALDKGVMDKPSKGKRMSREEYLAMVAEKMKEMGVEGDGPGEAGNHAVVIRIQQ